MTRTVKAGLVTVAVLLATACGGSTAEADQPKPPGWQIIHLPGSYTEQGTFCDHGNRLYVNHYGGSTSVVAGDPTCAEVPR